MKDGSFHWWPRAITIAAIIFISMFAVDSFSPGLSHREQIVGFLIHLIPSLILIGILMLAWNKELAGGIAFILVGLGFSPLIFIMNYNHANFWMAIAAVMMVTLPFLIAGILFVVSHRQAKRKTAG